MGGKQSKTTSKPSSKGGRKIVLPVDGSAASEKATQWTVDNILRPSDDIHLMTFVASQTPFISADTPKNNKEEEKAMKKAQGYCDRHMSIVKKSKKHAHVDCVPIHFIPGDSGVGPNIVQHSSDVGADLLVMGSRGLGAVERSLLRPLGLGSASDYAVHNAHMPVVVIKPQK
mmetsp:Transcript_34661/g.48048  ORF Transcript_34661/g.48048 Transcript_34661/m.48048 type:complete len:172 (-) Transcript_34661:246-761(-)|eukprot:CAMPEP_0196578946 /NCGR_PEP_ID=MMETSP1081-20130531/13594_1 /TAXON_ID=36882 /ORGANISM="Pyramimonas amylifera, Strain CCMP720" /LENGTH=171 /DNA_ID=CAMNT_0041898353 /DNA_START=97 /DNA_END=612 /DNA_ORIENTATION=-